MQSTRSNNEICYGDLTPEQRANLKPKETISTVGMFRASTVSRSAHLLGHCQGINEERIYPTIRITFTHPHQIQGDMHSDMQLLNAIHHFICHAQNQGLLPARPIFISSTIDAYKNRPIGLKLEEFKQIYREGEANSLFGVGIASTHVDFNFHNHVTERFTGLFKKALQEYKNPPALFLEPVERQTLGAKL